MEKIPSKVMIAKVPIIGKLFEYTLYIKFSNELVSINSVERKVIVEEKPLITVKTNNRGKRKVEKEGADAGTILQKDYSKIEIINPFDHPRCCISDADLAEVILRRLMRKAFKKSVSLVRPIVIAHPLQNINGGLSSFEISGLKNIFQTLGARETYIWIGAPLHYEQLINYNFSEASGELIKA